MPQFEVGNAEILNKKYRWIGQGFHLCISSYNKMLKHTLSLILSACLSSLLFSRKLKHILQSTSTRACVFLSQCFKLKDKGALAQSPSARLNIIKVCIPAGSCAVWWSTNLLPPALCIYFQVCSKVCPQGEDSAQLNGSPSCHPEFYMEQKKMRPQRELDCKIAHKIIGSESDRKCYEF